MKIVLYQPQIPQNTGNIIRTCSVTGCSLILIPPLGFSIDDKSLKRAGLDYFEGVDVSVESSLEAVIERYTPRIFFFSSKAKKSFYSVNFEKEDVLVFGAETHGLPNFVSENHLESCLRIPMLENARCLNLATSVGIAVYQAFRFFPQQLH